MEGNHYLIPANSKKSQMILSFFTPIDLVIFITGVGISVLLLLLVKSNNLGVLLGLATPALIATFLVLPVPNYHNIRILIGNVYRFLTGRKKYYWRGWCARYDNDKPKHGSRTGF